MGIYRHLLLLSHLRIWLKYTRRPVETAVTAVILRVLRLQPDPVTAPAHLGANRLRYGNGYPLRDSTTPTSTELELHLAQNTFGHLLDRPLTVLHRMKFQLVAHIGKAAFQRFWIELWRWLSFLDEHRELLRGYHNVDGVLEEYHGSIFLIHTINPLVSDYREIYDDVIAPETGFFTLLAPAWRRTTVEAGKIPAGQIPRYHDFYRMVDLLIEFAPKLHLRRDELIAGLGEEATIRDLATLFVSYASLLLWHSSRSDTSDITPDSRLLEFGVVFGWLIGSEHPLVVEQRFFPHLIRAGFFQVLFRVLSTIQAAESPWSRREHAGVTTWYTTLYWTIVMSNKVTAMTELIRNGVLEIILRAALRSDEPNANLLSFTDGPHAWFASLKNYLAYGRVVAVLGPAISCADDVIIHSERQLDPAFGSQWYMFRALASMKVQTFDSITANPSSEVSRCGSKICRKLRLRSELRPCSGCRWPTVYCDELCQRADWRDGHKFICGFGHGQHQLSKLDRRFLRSLVQELLHRQRIRVALGILQHMFKKGIVATGLRTDAIALLNKPDLPVSTALFLQLNDEETAPPRPSEPISLFGEFSCSATDPTIGLKLDRDHLFVTLAAGGFDEHHTIMVSMRCYFAQGCSLWGSLTDLAWEIASWDDEHPFESRSEEIRMDVEKIVEACGDAYV
ncbi:hypothetical protein HMN09_00210900 [Mycena chlorophos]|uniref:MYND-type domain-containing protein n=1 Tax=Mycena chlorophos TaxID=658473 RepID=A0A8H6WQV7_MYCCL|nr:hypothetical protein HMN09_00210900 [Mycena chlorophos]